MKLIPITKGLFVQVDDEDYGYLNKFKWKANGGNYPYASRCIGVNGKQKTILMHREILGISDNRIVDHKDRDVLNNQKSNLRIASHSQNAANRTHEKNHSSIYQGVHWNKNVKRWYAKISDNGKRLHLGCFKTEKEAAIAYNEAAIRVHKEFANINQLQ